MKTCRFVVNTSQVANPSSHLPHALQQCIEIAAQHARAAHELAESAQRVRLRALLEPLVRGEAALYAFEKGELACGEEIVDGRLVDLVLQLALEPQELLHDTAVQEGVARLDAVGARRALLLRQVIPLRAQEEVEPGEGVHEVCGEDAQQGAVELQRHAVQAIVRQDLVRAAARQEEPLASL